MATTKTATRLDVPKTYKLFIGGAFPRSESGRVTEVRSPDGGFVASLHLPLTGVASRTSDDLASH